MRKSKTFRLELVYLDLLKAIVKKNEGKMNNETTAVQVAIWELAKKDLEEEEIKEILKNFMMKRILECFK